MLKNLLRFVPFLALGFPALALASECNVNFGNAPAVNNFTTINAGTAGTLETCFNFNLLEGEAFEVTLTAVTFTDIPSLEFRNPEGGLLGSFGNPDVGDSFAWSNVPLAGTYQVNIWAEGPQFSFGSFRIEQFLAPVPEPETYALLLAGLVAVSTIARRHRA